MGSALTNFVIEKSWYDPDADSVDDIGRAAHVSKVFYEYSPEMHGELESITRAQRKADDPDSKSSKKKTGIT